MIPHNHDTHETRECEACSYRIAHDPYLHGRVDNFYLRYHLVAIVQDRQAGTRRRIDAAKALTHPSYPMQARRWAADEIVRLTDLQYGWRKDGDRD